jgi:hypothetical protein
LASDDNQVNAREKVMMEKERKKREEQEKVERELNSIR